MKERKGTVNKERKKTDMSTNETTIELNLIKGYRLKERKSYRRRYKGVYGTNVSFKGAVSSAHFLTMYTLFVLKDGTPYYGKQILDQIRTLIGNSSWQLSHGTLYPALAKMVKEGYIELVTDDAKFTGRIKNRKYYKITKQGERYFELNKEYFRKEVAVSKRFFKAVMNQVQ